MMFMNMVGTSFDIEIKIYSPHTHMRIRVTSYADQTTVFVTECA